jgi:tRNA1Val (adenine37-N6)-methyltransferase
MGRNNYFRFKEFTIIQQYAAMKVGVDSVLLGAWTNIADARNILDVGTGTGLLALMMAQRSDSDINAVEIDEAACHEARMNMDSSPWGSRITLHHISFQDFSAQTDRRFDIIISNPPYFENSSLPEDPKKVAARHTKNLSYRELIHYSTKLLTYSGTLSVILPTENSVSFVQIAAEKGLYLSRETWVKHHPKKPFHRRLMEFSATKKKRITSELIIEDQQGYSEQYKTITRDFYLAF